MTDRSLACEPLRVWNRLEPRPRTDDDFERCLRNEVHDPLWMLARQWQFGELQGEEAGSCITAKVALRESRIAQLTLGSGPQAATVAFDAVACSPLAPTALGLRQTFDAPARVRCGLHLVRLLEKRGLSAADARSFARSLMVLFPIEVPEAPTSPQLPDVVEYERQRASTKGFRLGRALSKRGFDGVALVEALPAGPLVAVPGSLVSVIPAAQSAIVLPALVEYRDWFVGLYGTPSSAGWVEESLEYRLSCSVPRDGASVELVAEPDGSGDLDWYTFDLASSQSTGQSSVRAFTVIPSLAEFPGMPRSRLWELEDASVDLAIGQADPTDLARVLVCEFALVYGNDWLVVPCAIPRGTLAEIEGILVTDVFGETTLIEPANHSALDWSSWDFFSLSPQPGGSPSDVGAHLLVPAIPGSVQRSEPVEAVAFVRDEGANMVWALETRVPDGLGGARDGREAGRALRERLGHATPTAPEQRVEGSPSLSYQLGTTVEEHWIPFLPVRMDPASPQIRLQRGSMPRFLGEAIAPVRPTTEILRPGLEAAVQLRPYFVREEEIARTGVRVESLVSRTRYPSGAVRVWTSRKKSIGRGEGSSGLAFDVLERH